MNFRAEIVALLGLLCLLCPASRLASAEPDPYAPLKLYDGGWQVTLMGPEKKTDHLVNHCARTGTFFSCEQQLNGKTAALVIFLPTGQNAAGAFEYRTIAALPDASRPDDWGHLAIAGNTWTYSWTQKDGEKIVEMRNVNQFKDNDHIHFELQKKGDDGIWKTQLSGDEQRSN